MLRNGKGDSDGSVSWGQELDPHSPVGDALQQVDLYEDLAEQAHAALAGTYFETARLEEAQFSVSIEEAYRVGCELYSRYEDKSTYFAGVDHVYNLYWNYNHGATFDDVHRLDCDLCRSL